jgi:hypothetical protein
MISGRLIQEVQDARVAQDQVSGLPVTVAAGSGSVNSPAGDRTVAMSG